MPINVHDNNGEHWQSIEDVDAPLMTLSVARLPQREVDHAEDGADLVAARPLSATS